ncbi:hypothetical protein ACLB2K_062735 [Fragaria x ananassa]
MEVARFRCRDPERDTRREPESGWVPSLGLSIEWWCRDSGRETESISLPGPYIAAVTGVAGLATRMGVQISFFFVSYCRERGVPGGRDGELYSLDAIETRGGGRRDLRRP